MRKIQNVAILIVGTIVLYVEAKEWKLCNKCETPINQFCCRRPEAVFKKDPQKKICCEFPDDYSTATPTVNTSAPDPKTTTTATTSAPGKFSLPFLIF